jgi:hypothetical protein
MTRYCGFPSPNFLQAMIINIKLYQQMTKIRVHVEKECRKVLRPDNDYSPTVQTWYDRILSYLQLICMKEGKTKHNGNIIRFTVHTNMQNLFNLTMEELKDGLGTAKLEKRSSDSKLKG